MQVLSHSRHPAEWDLLRKVWTEPSEPAVPYWPICPHAVPKPTRPRECLSVLLAAGLPLAANAHTAQLSASAAPNFLKHVKKLVHVARQRGQVHSVHLWRSLCDAGGLESGPFFMEGARSAAVCASRSAALCTLCCSVHVLPRSL